jgi:hypothetical protein
MMKNDQQFHAKHVILKMKKQTHSKKGRNFSAVIPAGVMVPENLTGMNYLLGATITWHGTITDEDSGGTPKEGCPALFRIWSSPQLM